MMNNFAGFPVVLVTVLRRKLATIKGSMKVGVGGGGGVPRPQEIMSIFQRMDLSVTLPHWESHTSPKGLLFVTKLRHFVPF